MRTNTVIDVCACSKCRPGSRLDIDDAIDQSFDDYTDDNLYLRLDELAGDAEKLFLSDGFCREHARSLAKLVVIRVVTEVEQQKALDNPAMS